MVGRTLGHYRIEERIGAGGMGVVYRATDLNLNRQVAIKVLPAECAASPERRSRFSREARLLASLNHQNIAAVHDYEEHDQQCFLVLEFVPGESLDELVSRKPPAVKDALRIARQIAAAVEAAHENGVIHRDLKPGNVKITPAGAVKVLDFGLAKAFEAAATASSETMATVTVSQTQEGVVIGTPAYMSPEQVRGLIVDKRTDIWAFGCVLYELLAHRRLFSGARTTSDFIAAILTQEPDWKALPAATPSSICKLLRRCLEKDPQLRLRDIGDAGLEIDEALAVPESPQEALQRKSRFALAALGGLALGATGVALGFIVFKPAPQPSPVTRFSIPLGPDETLHPLGQSVRLSPDGRRLAWVAVDAAGRTQVYTRALDRLESSKVEGAAGASSPSFSPDGNSLAFPHSASRTLRTIGLGGGAPVTVCPIESSSGPAWTRAGDLLLNLSYPGGVVRVPTKGGAPAPVTTLDEKAEERLHTRVFVLPKGKAILFHIAAAGMETYDDARIAVQSLETGERKTIIEGGMSPQYSPTGHIIYARDGQLLAVPFDEDRLIVTGKPVVVLEGVFMCVNTGAAHYSLSPSGTLAYAPGVILGGRRELVWVDRQGREEPIPLPQKPYLHPRISPNLKMIAVEMEGPVHDFWSYDIERGIMSKVTTEGSSHWPLWTPDGARITYRRWLGGAFSMWWMPADRSAPPERLTDIGRMQSAASWSPDGRVVAFTQVNPNTGPDVFVMEIASNRIPRPFADTRFSEGSPRFSPDGRWIAYASNESGRNEIYVQAYPGPGAKIQISTEGGTDAVWRAKGGELYYRSGDKMMVVDVNTAGAFRASRPRLLWTGRYAHGLGSACGPPGTTSSNYDVTPDGSRFLMIKHDEVAPARINVVLNWTTELKSKL
jgi:serine/threonine-protein kinase